MTTVDGDGDARQCRRHPQGDEIHPMERHDRARMHQHAGPAWAPPCNVAANTGAAFARTSVAETKTPQAAATSQRFHPRIR